MMSDRAHRILIAEDEPDLLLLISATLMSAGFDVVETADGIDALAAARQHLPDLALLDVMLPGLTGPEIARALREDPATAAMPIVMLSARGQSDDVEQGLESGADHYMVKPFIPSDLMRALRAILAGELPGTD
jgi:DNA-binding response OmpR family regulator